MVVGQLPGQEGGTGRTAAAGRREGVLEGDPGPASRRRWGANCRSSKRMSSHITTTMLGAGRPAPDSLVVAPAVSAASGSGPAGEQPRSRQRRRVRRAGSDRGCRPPEVRIEPRPSPWPGGTERALSPVRRSRAVRRRRCVQREPSPVVGAPGLLSRPAFSPRAAASAIAVTRWARVAGRLAITTQAEHLLLRRG